MCYDWATWPIINQKISGNVIKMSDTSLLLILWLVLVSYHIVGHFSQLKNVFGDHTCWRWRIWGWWSWGHFRTFWQQWADVLQDNLRQELLQSFVEKLDGLGVLRVNQVDNLNLQLLRRIWLSGFEVLRRIFGKIAVIWWKNFGNFNLRLFLWCLFSPIRRASLWSLGNSQWFRFRYCVVSLFDILGRVAIRRTLKGRLPWLLSLVILQACLWRVVCFWSSVDLLTLRRTRRCLLVCLFFCGFRRLLRIGRIRYGHNAFQIVKTQLVKKFHHITHATFAKKKNIQIAYGLKTISQNVVPFAKYWLISLLTPWIISVFVRWYVLVFLGVPQAPKRGCNWSINWTRIFCKES